MLKEYAREKGHEKETLAALSDHLNDLAYRNQLSAQAEEQSHVLQHCLERLPVASRSLIEQYFSTEGRNHIEVRQHLAQQCGISMNALRNRVLRIRAELERCFSARSQQLDPTGPEMFPSQMTQEDDEQ
jgi:DNA-directed RNA polymerase specialized sigma24 family protein